jgi:hypothetical protein
MAQDSSPITGMRPRPLIEAVSIEGRVDVSKDGSGLQVNIPALNALALQSLISLFDEKQQLFSRRVILTAQGLHREGTSRKRTIIALLGLQRLTESGEAPPLDVRSIRDAVLGDTSWVENVGDLGLLTWFTAECEPERLGRLLDEFDFETALNSYSDGRQARTLGLARLLAGISHARLACTETLPDLTDVAVDTYHLLQENQGEGGIFGHAAFTGFPQQTFCGRFGTFADQIYAIYALSTFARAFQIEEPLESALGCANAVRALQGEMGQWWFLYHKRAIKVVNRYPVISLHQDGIAPVGLIALEAATGQSFHESINKGLSWIAGANELRNDLRSLDRGLIWDSIEPRRRIANYWQAALNIANIPHEPSEGSLRVRYEARPDHFGWLLYAFGRCGLPKARNAANVAETR